jgi:nicotinamidase-related amidase
VSSRARTKIPPVEQGKPTALEPSRAALLCLDCQTGIVSFYAHANEQFLPKVAQALEHARAAGIRVIYVRVGFRMGLPEIGNSRNKLFSSIKSDDQRRKLFEGSGSEIHPAILPKQGDIEVVKHRVSAFTGTDLELILRANSIDTLVLCGIATSGVVLSTLVDAFDRDYRMVVIGDLCLDRDQELHKALVDKYFPNRGEVITASEFMNR